MKRSESKAYLSYGASKASGNYKKAHKFYTEFLNENKGEWECLAERVNVLQELAEIYFLLGQEYLSNFLFTIAFDADPDSLTMKLKYARFQYRRRKNYNLALNLCAEIIDSEGHSDESEANRKQRQINSDFARQLVDEIRDELKEM